MFILLFIVGYGTCHVNDSWNCGLIIVCGRTCLRSDHRIRGVGRDKGRWDELKNRDISSSGI